MKTCLLPIGCFLERIVRLESNSFLRFNVDAFSRTWVTSHSCSSIVGFKGSKSSQTDGTIFCNSFHNGVQDSVQDSFALGQGHVVVFGNFFDNLPLGNPLSARCGSRGRRKEGTNVGLAEEDRGDRGRASQ